MAALYYLVSSLPLLTLGEKPPFSSDKYIEMCKTFLTEKQMEDLLSLNLIPNHTDSADSEVINRWYDWETCLRNSVAKIRSSVFNKDFSSFLKYENDYFSEIDKGVQEAYSADNPLEKEDAIDKLRWTSLDNIEAKHQFDFGKLCIYKIRLMLCEKRMKRSESKGKENLDNTLSELYSNQINETI
ncbi:MAG TPA: hypothetical protein QF753_12860 [Victivallales bacterium]|nr:hypothetical protein [Victivallales bacterium]